MSSTREDTVVCPGCARPGIVTLHASVDAGVEPALKELLLRGKLSVFTCASCRREARIAHPLRYEDAAKGAVVQLDPEGTCDVAALARELGAHRPRVCRLVRDGNALIEKVRIVDAALDDHVIEVMKLLLALSHAQYASAPWYFERAEDGGALLFAIVTAKGPFATRRSRAEYDAIAADLERRGALAPANPAEPFVSVDRDYARRWLAEPSEASTI